MKLCTVCQRPCDGSRCPDHKRRRSQGSATARGYDYRYQKLRARAIAIQPFCTDCLTTGTPDNPLGLDHTEAAWRKVDSGKALTLKDVRDGLLVVRCLRCNIAAGRARGTRINHT